MTNQQKNQIRETAHRLAVTLEKVYTNYEYDGIQDAALKIMASNAQNLEKSCVMLERLVPAEKRVNETKSGLEWFTAAPNRDKILEEALTMAHMMVDTFSNAYYSAPTDSWLEGRFLALETELACIVDRIGDLSAALAVHISEGKP